VRLQKVSVQTTTPRRGAMTKQAGRPWKRPSWRMVVALVFGAAPSEILGSAAPLKEETVVASGREGTEGEEGSVQVEPTPVDRALVAECSQEVFKRLVICPQQGQHSQTGRRTERAWRERMYPVPVLPWQRLPLLTHEIV